MPVELNHTIVAATDRDRTADFLVDILGLEPATTYGPFRVVALANGVSLDVVGSSGPVHPQHYAFLVSEEEFDLIWARIRERDLVFCFFFNDTATTEIYTNDGGRGLYWQDPDGHSLEIITRPYGG